MSWSQDDNLKPPGNEHGKVITADEYENRQPPLVRKRTLALVRKWTTIRTERYAGIMEHFHVWLLDTLAGRLVSQDDAGSVTVLVRLNTRFAYRNAAVRSAPPDARFRVFKCAEHH